MRVSWQLTGVRQDAWANAHPIVIEEEKTAKERGNFLHPQLHGASSAKSIGEVRHPRPKEI
jgi:hypothetical protein